MNPMQQQGWQPQFQQSMPPAPAPAVTPPASNPGQWAVGAAQDAGGNGLAMAHLLNRTVAIVPLELLKDQPIRNQPGKVQDVIKADVLILDGPTPFTFGGSPQGKPAPTPDTMAADQLPFLVPGTSRIFGVVIVDQLKSKVGTGIVIGKVVMLPTGSGNTAYQITTDVSDEHRAFVQQWAMDYYQRKTWVNPPVRMLAGPPLAQAYAPQSAAPYFAYGQPQGLGGQAYLAAPYVPQAQQQFAPVQAAPQFPAFQPPAAPVVDWTLNTMPPHVPAEQLTAWQTQLTREQREQMLTAAGITGPNVAPGQPTGL